MSITNVKSRWVNGDLIFYDASGNQIAKFDNTNQALDITNIYQSGTTGIAPTSFRDASITAAKLANGAGLSALIAAGLGASANYSKTTAGAQDLAVSAVGARACICVVVVTEVFADGTGAQPTFIIGDETADNSIMTVAKLDDAALGSVHVFAGQVTAAEKLVVTATAATGTGTGAISVAALLLPE